MDVMYMTWVVVSTYIVFGFIIVGAVLSMVAQFRYIHVMQLESYQNEGFSNWLKANRKKALLLPLIAGWSALVGYYFWSLLATAGEANIGFFIAFIACYGVAVFLTILHIVQ